MQQSAVLPVFSPFPVRFVRGEGVYLFDENNRKYLDFGSGVAVNALGHCHPALLKALTEQGSKLWHCSNWYQITNQEQLAKTITDNSFADVVFLCNSGTEAIECTIKMVRAYFSAQQQPQRHRIITFHNAFHGRTFGAMAATGRGGFEPGLPGFDHVAYNDLEALKAAITPATAAVLIEPVQGEGGAIPATLEYLQAVRSLCDQHGILMCLDEIQTGIGRTGKLFAYEWAGIAPDILASAKGIGGGFPLGACLATHKAASGLTKGMHGSTFGGNPLASAVGQTVLHEILQPGFLQQVDTVARYLWQQLLRLLKTYPQVFSDARGAGLLLALKCTANNRTVAEALLEKGLLVIPAGDNVIRLIPPLIITHHDVDQAIHLLTEYATTVSVKEHSLA